MVERVYRPVPEEDYEQMAANALLAFGESRENSLRWLRSPVRSTETRGIYVGERLVTQMELYPLQIMAGRTAIACGGIGAVATPPHERRRGHVAVMLRALCDELRDREMPLAMLGPFKESFYGRYGWAIFGERRVYSGKPERFAPFPALPGQYAPAGPEHIDELNAIYTGALRGRFGPLVRPASWWQHTVIASAYWQHPMHAFIWRDEVGRGRAYLVYRLISEGEKTSLRCREMVALDPEARSQLFVFLANHLDQVEDIRFFAPADAPVNLLFPDSLDCTVEGLRMLRIVDLTRLLTVYPYPSTSRGRLTIAVTDDWLPDNQGVFALEVADGVGQVSRLADDTPAGLRCDQRVLVQLISRFLRPRTAAAFGLLEAPDRAALALAEELFAGLPPFFSDWF